MARCDFSSPSLYGSTMSFVMAAFAYACGSLTIDLVSLVVNWRALRTVAAPAATGAVVNANAYGLGWLRVRAALAAAGCSHFFVAHLSEAREPAGRLPAAASLYVLNGLEAGAEAEIGRAHV